MNKPFNTVNSADKKEATKAYIIPMVYSLSTLKIKYKPAITIKPKSNSSNIKRLLKNKGSIRDVNSAPVLMAIKAIETLAIFIAVKKATQCNAIIIPLIRNFNNPFGVVLSDFFLIIKNNKRKSTANNILYHTNGMASILISAPNMAVNPQMNTNM